MSEPIFTDIIIIFLIVVLTFGFMLNVFPTASLSSALVSDSALLHNIYDDNGKLNIVGIITLMVVPIIVFAVVLGMRY